MAKGVATKALRSPNQTGIVRVALPVPLPTLFDYVLPSSMQPEVQPGMRAVVPFGRRRLVGIVVECATESACNDDQLKTLFHILDEQPLLTTDLLSLLRWISDYYHAPIGEAVLLALTLQ